MVASASPASETPASVGTVGRLTGALFNPKPTFEDIARQPSWIVPIVLLCLLSLAITYLFGQRVGWRSFMEKQLANNSRVQQLPPERREEMVEQQAKWAPMFGYVIGPVAIVVVALVIAGVLLGIFNGIAGAGLNFRTSLGIVSHAWVPGIIGQLLGILILFVKDPATVDLQNLVASNPGALLSDESPKWLVGLLSSFDLFSFWTIALLAVGFSVARPKKLSFGRALGLVVACWMAYVLVKVGWAAIFS